MRLARTRRAWLLIAALALLTILIVGAPARAGLTAKQQAKAAVLGAMSHPHSDLQPKYVDEYTGRTYVGLWGPYTIRCR